MMTSMKSLKSDTSNSLLNRNKREGPVQVNGVAAEVKRTTLYNNSGASAAAHHRASNSMRQSTTGGAI